MKRTAAAGRADPLPPFLFYEERREDKMIQISKDEAKLIRNKMPGVPIKRTVNKYYIEERPVVMRLLGRTQQRKEVR